MRVDLACRRTSRGMRLGCDGTRAATNFSSMNLSFYVSVRPPVRFGGNCMRARTTMKTTSPAMRLNHDQRKPAVRVAAIKADTATIQIAGLEIPKRAAVGRSGDD